MASVSKSTRNVLSISRFSSSQDGSAICLACSEVCHSGLPYYVGCGDHAEKCHCGQFQCEVDEKMSKKEEDKSWDVTRQEEICNIP